MRNIVPSHVWFQRSSRVFIIGLIVFFLGLLACVVGLTLVNIPLVVPGTPQYRDYVLLHNSLIGAGLLLTLIGVIALLRSVTWRRDNALARETGDRIAPALNDRYTFIRNMNRLPLGYIDALLIGPEGVLVCRVTDREGVYYNEGRRWMIQRDRGKWRTLNWNPSEKVLRQIEAVEQYLEARDIMSIPVHGVIIFAKGEPVAQYNQSNPAVLAAYPHNLRDALARTYFANTEPLPAPVVAELVRIFYD